VKALWNLRWPGAREALMAMLSDGEELVRLSAVWVLGEIEMSDRRAVLQAREAQDPSPKVRAKIREVLAAMPAKEVRA
jgi:HEAT repeat protein